MNHTPISRALAHATVAAWLAALPAAAQDPGPANAAVEVIDVADGVYMLAGLGGNIALSVGGDGAFLVDNQFAHLTDKIVEAVRSKTDKPVAYLFNTHWHGDHTGGNGNFRALGVPIIAHENVRARMSVDNKSYLSGSVIEASPPSALPVVTFSESATIYQDGQKIDLIKVPAAHTDGDGIVVFHGANVIHMGDVFLNDIYPFIDYGSGGSLAGMIEAVDLGLDLADDDTRIIPGHGELGTRADMVRYRDMLIVVRDRVAEGRASGRTLDDLLSENPLGDLEDEWGGTPFRNGTQVYKSVFEEENLP